MDAIVCTIRPQKGSAAPVHSYNRFRFPRSIGGDVKIARMGGEELYDGCTILQKLA